jgi:hypothetical protein
VSFAAIILSVASQLVLVVVVVVVYFVINSVRKLLATPSYGEMYKLWSSSPPGVVSPSVVLLPLVFTVSPLNVWTGLRILFHCYFVFVLISFLLLTGFLLTWFLLPWCKILFENLIVTQVVKQYPALFMEYKDPLPYSQKPVTGLCPEPAESSSPHRSLSPKVHLNVILPPTRRSPSGLLLLSLPTKTP